MPVDLAIAWSARRRSTPRMGLFIRLAASVEEVGAKRVVLDTIEVLFSALGNEGVVRGELGRLFRWLKDRGLTAVVTGERGRRVS